jgi:hypothetical protein
VKFTGEKTKGAKISSAIDHANRLKRLKKLNSRVRGKFRKFMTRADLESMRNADTVKSK